MTESVTIVVCGRPVPKGRPRIGSVNGRAMAFTPAATRKYEAHARMAAQQAMAGRAPIEGPLEVEVTALLPIPSSWSGKRSAKARQSEIVPTKRPDLDNFIKAAMDACNGIVFKDDSQAVVVKADKRYGLTPGLVVTVTPLVDVEAA